MSHLSSQLSFQTMSNFLCFLIINPDYCIPTRSGEASTIWRKIKSKDLIVILDGMPELFACFGYELEEMAIGIGN